MVGNRTAATWIFAVALIAAALAFTLWQRADDDAEFTGETPDRGSAHVALAVAGVAAICGTIVYATPSPDDGDPPTPRDPDPPPMP